MDIYHGFLSLKPGVRDTEFATAIADYLDWLKADGRIHSWRLMRRKLGLGPPSLGEFHLMIEVTGLAQLDEAFGLVATRSGEVEARHFAVNSKVDKVTFALYRDFPDSVRETGDEKF